nr:hypothetical protein [Caldinitratiruptor microaerophilus]
MWTVVYIAPSKAKADRIKEILTREGFLVNLRVVSQAGGPSAPVEVLVPQGEAREAHEILAEHLGRSF